MNPIPTESLVEALNWRYATKAFDPSQRIPPKTWAALEQSLVLTPSSYGLQPWKFVVVTEPAMKEALVAHSWNQRQPADCSHHVVFAARQFIDDDYVDRYLARISAERGIPVETLAGYRKVMVGDVVKGPRSAQAFEWAARQSYIALGQFMTAAAVLGVDTCPMEGILPKRYDEVLGLEGSGYGTVVACAAGFRARDDRYASLKKVRFEASDVVQPM